MAHKTLVGGTAYEISGGKTLVSGTAYSIVKGKTLVGGTAYEIGFTPALKDCTPAEIQAIARSGQAPNYWAVGDMVGIYLSGTVGALSLSGTYYAFIIGFNHNSSIEGNNTIHFQFGKTADGTDIAFVDGNYVSNGSSAGFRMNTSSSSDGGWASSYMRSTICPAFLAAMPSAWQSVIKACTKYTHNANWNSAANITATSDKIWLLAEFEMSGVCNTANSAEQNYQKQYDYYKNGNSKLKYRHSETTKTARWWLRSVTTTLSTRFCAIDTGGSSSYYRSNYSYGFAPGFMVG